MSVQFGACVVLVVTIYAAFTLGFVVGLETDVAITAEAIEIRPNDWAEPGSPARDVDKTVTVERLCERSVELVSTASWRPDGTHARCVFFRLTNGGKQFPQRDGDRVVVDSGCECEQCHDRAAELFSYEYGRTIPIRIHPPDGWGVMDVRPHDRFFTTTSRVHGCGHVGKIDYDLHAGRYYHPQECIIEVQFVRNRQ